MNLFDKYDSELWEQFVTETGEFNRARRADMEKFRDQRLIDFNERLMEYRALPWWKRIRTPEPWKYWESPMWHDIPPMILPISVDAFLIWAHRREQAAE